MHQLRKRLTYANVMSSIAVFLVLGGGAVAATQLPMNSVGTKQLKNSAVTTAKLKNSAVTTAKIKKSAINGNKIADGSITGIDINTSKTTFGRVVAKLRGSAPLTLTEELKVLPLNPSTYAQAAEEDDSYISAVDISFPSECEAPRSATAYLLVDPTNSAKLEPLESVVGSGHTEDKAGGVVAKRIEIGPYKTKSGELEGMTRFEPGTAKSRTVDLVVEGKCKSGSGIAATFGGVDVIGTK